MRRKKPTPISKVTCIARISPDTVTITRLNEVQFNVYFEGVYFDNIQRIGKGWGFCAGNQDRRCATPMDAAIALVKWNINKYPRAYVGRLQIKHGPTWPLKEEEASESTVELVAV